MQTQLIGLNSDMLLLAMMILTAFLILAILVSMCRIYKKAGKPAISAIIPIWSQITLFQIVEKPVWYFILLFVPIVGIVINIQAYVLLAKKFGKGSGFAVGMIFLPMIFFPLLSFYDYVGNEEKITDTVYNPFNETNLTQVMPSEPLNQSGVPQVVPTEIITQPVVEASVVENNPVGSIPVENTPAVVEQNIPEQASIESNPSIPEVAQVSEQPSVVVPPVMESNSNIQVQSDPVSVEPVITTMNSVVSNVDIQDINSSVKTMINPEPMNIAFQSTPTPIEPLTMPSNGVINAQNEQSVDVLSPETMVEQSMPNTTPVQNSLVEETIEMPEVAAKKCPACGVSLAADVQFCTSCGTKI